ncbi:MAG TPA: hypothetical protein VN646_16940 [Candidatus Acidoferrum sp.]|nr:hypothetical protein [Candidatus Acidoferrum sp.]
MSLARRFLEWASQLLPRPRVITDLDGSPPYLSRFYLLGRPRMPDGSDPFDRFGAIRAGAVEGERFGVYLHRFHRGDMDRELHNHPWRWSFSLILAGGYIEERRSGNQVNTRAVFPGSINWLSQDTFHRVELLDGEAWSLFVAGPKVQSWGFWDRVTGAFTPWREYIARTRAERAR